MYNTFFKTEEVAITAFSLAQVFLYVMSLLDNYVSISHTMLTVISEILFINKNMQVISWTTISILNAYKTCPRDEFIWETY